MMTEDLENELPPEDKSELDDFITESNKSADNELEQAEEDFDEEGEEDVFLDEDGFFTGDQEDEDEDSLFGTEEEAEVDLDDSPGRLTFGTTISPPGPKIEEEEEVDAPELAGDLDAEDYYLDIFVTDDAVASLMARADTAAEDIKEKVDNVNTARKLFNQIRSMKTLLLAGRGYFEEAERALNEVEYQIAYNERARVWSKFPARNIAIYEVIWGVFLMLFWVFVPAAASTFVRTGGAGLGLSLTFPSFINPDDIFNLVGAMMWGGLGGIVGALHSLWRYVSTQDYNPRYNIWYYLQPIMGLPIGAFIFVFVKISFNATAGNTGAEIGSPFAIYLLAWIAGFQQNVIYSIVRQVLNLFNMGDDEEEEVPEPELELESEPFMMDDEVWQSEV